MAAPRDHGILIGILDKLFADLSNAEVAALQERWIGTPLDRRQPWREVLIYGLPGLLAVLGIFAVIMRINRRLSAEISNREALETELRSSEQHFRGLVESLSAIAWEVRMSDRAFTYVSRHAQKLLGYPPEDWLQPGFWERSMQLKVIAEGVETKAQERFLGLAGCEQIQGYVLSHPLPAEAFAHNFLGLRHSIGAPEKAPV